MVRRDHSWLSSKLDGLWLVPGPMLLGPRSGPVNYAFCSGSGVGGGDATGADGAFILGPAISVAGLTDGSSMTVAASEQLLGFAGPYSQTTPDPIPSPPSQAIA